MWGRTEGKSKLRPKSNLKGNPLEKKKTKAGVIRDIAGKLRSEKGAITPDEGKKRDRPFTLSQRSNGCGGAG